MARYEAWINRAKGSLKLSKIVITFGVDDGYYYEDLCCQTQQAVEKALKGFLIYFDVEPEFTHNIETLINKLEKFTEVPEHIKEATNLTKYAVLTRYPGEYEEVTKEKYEQAVNIAQECLEWVENRIEENENAKTK
ncbi:MAG: HEPN domain-containing protein [Treponema sp.]|jgi:HEPN domain-containing protein|nr:HEPN domain-containing protein [Treponema sp.]